MESDRTKWVPIHIEEVILWKQIKENSKTIKINTSQIVRQWSFHYRVPVWSIAWENSKEKYGWKTSWFKHKITTITATTTTKTYETKTKQLQQQQNKTNKRPSLPTSK